MSALDRESRAAYEAWHRSLPAEETADMPWHRLLFRHLDLERDVAGRAVLEIGCGRGELSRRLAALDRPPRRMVAADFAVSAVSKGRALAARHRESGVLWQAGDVTAIGHPDGAFDTVISCETVEHVPGPQRAVAELARVLRPGGRLYLTTPNYLTASGLYRAYCRLRGRVYREAGQPVNNLMLLPRTRAMVRRAGLRVLAADAVGFFLLWPGRPPIELPALEWDGVRRITRWVGLHSIVVGEKT